MALPLEGVVVADLTQNVAGPFCTQILGDMGAEVVKVERPGRGDDARAWAPPFWGDESATFMAMNRNKKSLALDVKQDGGLEVLWRLVARADVFVQSLRAGAVAELGLDFERAARANPRLVYCAITAFGARGPLRDLPGYDPLMQAYGGLMSVNGHPGQEPARVGTSIVDMATGMWAALGIVAALRQRDATGRAVEVTTALFETALMWVSYHAMGYLGSGEVPQPQGSGTAMIAPYQAFPTADGFAMIAAGAECLLPRAREDDRADERIALEGVEAGKEILAHGGVHRVHLLGAVQRDGHDVAVVRAGDEQVAVRGHGMTPPALRPRTSSRVHPSQARTSSVCSPRSGGTRRTAGRTPSQRMGSPRLR